MSERVVLIRHGETTWSLQRKHTGRTDIPLNDEGCRLAAALGPTLATIDGIATAHVLTSPLQRARQTCDLAGLGSRAEVCDDLLEWDYGIYEGRRTSEVQATVPGWTVWTSEIPGGESLADVGARADRVIAHVRALDGLTVLVAHAHLLRILAARWCGLAPVEGRILTLDPASISLLGHERDTPVIERWNLAPPPIGNEVTGPTGAAATISRMSADGSPTS
ncbi:MAG: histidine phosphatase family protein [Ilumatobacteraceae bacterium]